ncbi:hypothetical protein [Ornithinimicrobium cavernae]|uniref:hypothetical protein n=1 Tax=Ornithinimicrobium cavernae TaxID=2666047 RepID=UPI00192A25D2|nr:hypothetical protein [Ornithinimicrobium cavernae]
MTTVVGRRPVAASRRRLLPGQKRLLAASAMMLIGAFLPWLYTPLGNFTGMSGPGLWTATVAMLALAGALVPLRMLAVAQAVIAAAVATVIPLWQFWHMFSQVGMAGWMPGPGLLLTFVGGLLSGIAAWQLLHLEVADG